MHGAKSVLISCTERESARARASVPRSWCACPSSAAGWHSHRRRCSGACSYASRAMPPRADPSSAPIAAPSPSAAGSSSGRATPNSTSTDAAAAAACTETAAAVSARAHGILDNGCAHTATASQHGTSHHPQPTPHLRSSGGDRGSHLHGPFPLRAHRRRRRRNGCCCNLGGCCCCRR